MIKKMILLTLLASACIGHAQIYFSENFDSGNANSWTVTDNDSDNSTVGIDYDQWYVADAYASLVTNSDGFAAVSHSLAPDGGNWVAYNPNNFLISPQIDLTAALATDLKLKFDIGSGQLAGGHEEHYAVYITNSNTVNDIESATPVFEETLPTSSASNMESHVIDISSYAGQAVYLTIRHFNCTGQFNLLADNISIEQVLQNNASISNLALNRYSLTNTNNLLEIDVANEGSSAITSIEIDWNDGIAHTSTISGLNIAPFSTETVSHPTQVSYSTVTEEVIDVTITQVNGVADTDPTGNTASTNFNTISTHVDKNVLIEEGTGTWCPSCPSGTVMMEEMHASYPTNFIGVAVHVNDPMTLSDYQTESNFIAIPTFHADRKILDQAIPDADAIFNQLVQLEVPALLESNIILNGNNLIIDASATFNTVFSNSNLRLGAIITEDDVSGSTSEYDQSNVYSGGTYGPMGGYENLPDPVPANQMVYNHVGRALIGGYSGQSNSVPASITDGQIVNYTFNYTVPQDVNASNLTVVLVLINQTTGEIECASKTNGPLSVSSLYKDVLNTTVYPNPAEDMVNIRFTGHGEDCIITIHDLSGKEVLTQSFENVQNEVDKDFSVNHLQTGSYFVTVSSNGISSTKQLIIQ